MQAANLLQASSWRQDEIHDFHSTAIGAFLLSLQESCSVLADASVACLHETDGLWAPKQVLGPLGLNGRVLSDIGLDSICLKGTNF